MTTGTRGICRHVTLVAAVLTAGGALGCGDGPQQRPLAPTPPVQSPSPALRILSVTPTAGSMRGGNSVTIAGTGLVPGARVTFGTVEVMGHVDARSSDKIYVVAPSHAPGTVNIQVTNPDHQTDMAIGAYTFALPGSFDVDGEWNGGAITGHEPFAFTVVNRSVVSVSCWGSGTVMLSPPAPIRDGEFSFSGEDGVAISGTIVSPVEAKGLVTLGQCVNSDWYAFRELPAADR